jgi:fatty acid-binding protein DegV
VHFLNGKDIEPDKFYKILKESKEMPAASQPTPGDFIKKYSNLLNGSDKIISLHISSKLSGTP